MSSQVYVAALADATASRLLPPARRARLQAELRAALPELNRRYRRALAARFAVTLGDELQGLLTRPAPCGTSPTSSAPGFPRSRGSWRAGAGRSARPSPPPLPRSTAHAFTRRAPPWTEPSRGASSSPWADSPPPSSHS